MVLQRYMQIAGNALTSFSCPKQPLHGWTLPPIMDPYHGLTRLMDEGTRAQSVHFERLEPNCRPVENVICKYVRGNPCSCQID